MVPAASADTISVGGTVVGTVTLTQGGTCNGVAIDSTSVCVDIEMNSGTQVRLGGPVIGFNGNVNEGGTTAIGVDSSGALDIKTTGDCGGAGNNPALCLEANGSATASS